jgi:uncharacterized membrane protein YuzA (DUF378 family)
MGGDKKMLKGYLKMLPIVLVLVGALNWGLVGSMQFDLVQYLVGLVGVPGVAPALYLLVGLAAVYLASKRDTYLPFLGKSAFPCGPLVEKEPSGADVSVTVLVKPNSNIVYWAAEPGQGTYENPWIAYDKYANSGVARSDAEGKATLNVRSPAGYKVNKIGAFEKTLKPHVHYRVCSHEGMMGPVLTAKSS